MNELAELLIEKGITISSVESFTVGNFATMLGSIPGISKVYKGSLITYQSETKERLLSIDLCVSFTGNAGPNAMEGKPVGEVYIGIAYQDVVVYKLNLTGSRQEIASKAVEFAKKKIIEKINENLKKN